MSNETIKAEASECSACSGSGECRGCNSTGQNQDYNDKGELVYTNDPCPFCSPSHGGYKLSKCRSCAGSGLYNANIALSTPSNRYIVRYPKSFELER